jgi:hypothetical protein
MPSKPREYVIAVLAIFVAAGVITVGAVWLIRISR